MRPARTLATIRFVRDAACTLVRAAGTLLVVFVASCGRERGATPLPVGDPPRAGLPDAAASPAARHLDEAQRLLSPVAARCGACHSLGVFAQQVAQPVRGSLTTAWRRTPADRQTIDCPHLPALEPAVGRALGTWLDALVAAEEPLAAAVVTAGAIAHGDRLVRELACTACHPPQSFEGLEAAYDLPQMSAFLRDPTRRFAGLAHPRLAADEAHALAAWLLRASGEVGAAEPGFAFECFELQIDDGDEPTLDGLVPAAAGVAARLDVAPRTRDEHFALRFAATLDVPASGDWQFTLGCDDGGWLWIDGRLVVDNGGLKPHQRVGQTVPLTAGAHELRVVYTQAAGGKSLEVLWQGPGVAQQSIPTERAKAALVRLTPPSIALPRVGAGASGGAGAPTVAEGRREARARRCDLCHEFADEAFAALPPPPAPPAWHELGDGTCPSTRAGSLRQSVGELPVGELDAATLLPLSLLQDGCLSCHARDGRFGLPPAVRNGLVDVEDLGDEGRLPPDLTGIGARLRPEWLVRVVRDGHAARPYVRARMPAYGAERAERYARLFAVDRAGGAASIEPPLDTTSVERGRLLVGTGGRNCITCHTCQGHRSLGPQGMDLAFQYERLEPAHLREWLLHPDRLRPGTRMPALWARDDAAARAEVEAVMAWLSLGAAAPLPPGVRVDAGSLVLEPIDRPLLHAAFLEGLSARGLAVGTPLRAHWAWDLAGARLAWLWRGAFLDARGTWEGRAGQLLRPLGQDWQRLDDCAVRPAGAPADGPGAPRRLLGQRRTSDDYPVLLVGVGEGPGVARYSDELRPQIRRGGSGLRRTLRCEQGELVFTFPPAQAPLEVLVDGRVASRHELRAGEVLTVEYRW